MRAVIPRRIVLPGAMPEGAGPRRVQHCLAPILDLAGSSDSLIVDSIGVVPTKAGRLHIPRFVFLGPKGGGDTIRFGIFATLHGGETKGLKIVGAFLRALEANPSLAKGCHIFAYPICDVSGFAAENANRVSAQDLATHFWRGSQRVEAYYLERELGVHQFHGVMSLHISADNRFVYALNKKCDSVLHEALARPALAAASASHATGDYAGLSGFLTNTDELRRTPFEINWKIPCNQTDAAVTLLISILDSYRTLLGLSQNI